MSEYDNALINGDITVQCITSCSPGKGEAKYYTYAQQRRSRGQSRWTIRYLGYSNCDGIQTR